mmetsp:Transcript_13062/g.20280  ORF Transcript_13062/g.20280 Transcript_13062/m.20280 type:complete len:142 (+) Transcript_13062:961-1386(+)|eukprot:CAMPEP_0170489820 /NCGR_PEP_ID=MMETSP0208-20121228/8123_1 /TAXON_ID=197538 /ORGANISM="Strombidium inclinatum, Strain S3" /LENGTH=141 /DNA_ID=CAMNT_0010764925 /DNA_START=493 /DNA_END=918 /DNA_ORIENTATION=-
MQNYKEPSFVAFVGREHLMDVSFEMVKFLNEGESFLSYERPASHIDLSEFGSDLSKDEAITRHSLMTKVNQDDFMMSDSSLMLPFPCTLEDIKEQEKTSLDSMEKLTMVNHFGDIDQMGLKIDAEKDIKSGSSEDIKALIE